MAVGSFTLAREDCRREEEESDDYKRVMYGRIEKKSGRAANLAGLEVQLPMDVV